MERFYSYNTVNLLTRDTVSAADGKNRFPFDVRGGISFAGDRLTVAAEIAYQRWSQYTEDGIQPPDLRDDYRVAVGGELLPKKESTAPFTQRIAYHLGAFYDATYYSVLGQPINELGLTGGFGFPVYGDTKLNIGFGYSWRGRTDLGLQKDNIVRFSITLSGGETWFLRPEEQ